MVDPFTVVGAQEQGYARMRQQESQFSRGQIQQAAGQLQQQGQFDQRQQLAETQQKMQLVDQQERIKQGMIENVRQERQIRRANERMDAMMKLNQVKAETASTRALVAKADLEARQAKQAAGALGGADVQDIGRVVPGQSGLYQLQLSPDGRNVAAQLIAEDSPAAQRHRRMQNLEEQNLARRAQGADGVAGGPSLSQSQRYIDDLDQIIADPLGQYTDAEIERAKKVKKEMMGRIDRVMGTEKIGIGEDVDAGPIAGVRKMATEVFNQYKGLARRAAKASGIEPERIKADMGSWVAEQLRADPSLDPEELAIDYMNFLTERYTGTRR